MKRKARAFKIADEPYFKAMERAKKDGKHLATMIEDFVVLYASGYDFDLKSKGSNIVAEIKVQRFQDLTKENAIGKVYDPFKNKRFTDKNKVYLK